MRSQLSPKEKKGKGLTEQEDLYRPFASLEQLSALLDVVVDFAGDAGRLALHLLAELTLVRGFVRGAVGERGRGGSSLPASRKGAWFAWKGRAARAMGGGREREREEKHRKRKEEGGWLYRVRQEAGDADAIVSSPSLSLSLSWSWSWSWSLSEFNS